MPTTLIGCPIAIGASYRIKSNHTATHPPDACYIQIAGKRDPALEGEVLAWIEAIVGEKLTAGSFEDVLRDGVVLCKLIEKLQPGSVPKINTSGGQFKFMENINHFQTACRRYGVPDVDVFQTVDLYEKRNIPAVTQCIMALGRTCYLHPEFKGPFLGPKVSDLV